ncbi:hypothetical protein DEI97_017095 [Curtobacterium sp. MCLR17_032]|uniref:hypothetical protein n=1 Tax=Curtobacterium sp. MCLR17_032 TaxID=2175650 RepID=UPI0011B80ABE|nr:hypothetical protein [Curtobacterium sp. MCLR17_032]WIE61438.1 hypothetical protein DEI97_017095 [Curtobacterium sp. MCLR17_032]
MSHIEAFSQLAEKILSAYNSTGNKHDALGAISNEHLQAFMARSEFDPGDFLAWSIGTKELPVQGWNFDFGEPAITVARNDLLRIDLLFWMQKAAPVHDHVTCGSFGALLGDRLHTRYSFDGVSAEDADITVGQLNVHDFHFMREGEAAEIQPDLIHDIYWLDTPSVTIVVRCNEHPGVTRRPADYLWPGLRIVDPLRLQDSLVKRRTEALDLLAQADEGIYVEAMTEVFRSGSASQKVAAFVGAAVAHPDALDGALAGLHQHDEVLTQLTRGRAALVKRSTFGGTFAGEDDEAQMLAGLLWANVERAVLLEALAEIAHDGDGQAALGRAYAGLLELGDLQVELDTALGALGLLPARV